MKGRLQLVGGSHESVDFGRLAGMRPNELRQLHRTLFGTDVAFGNAEQSRRRIAFRVQVEREGGLPESARQHALTIARAVEFRLRARFGTRAPGAVANGAVSELISGRDPRLPMPGSVLVREYRGRTIAVRVLDDGFEYDERRFTSLSALATKVTGTKWNGLAFFGLTRAHGR